MPVGVHTFIQIIIIISRNVRIHILECKQWHSSIFLLKNLYYKPKCIIHKHYDNIMGMLDIKLKVQIKNWNLIDLQLKINIIMIKMGCAFINYSWFICHEVFCGFLLCHLNMVWCVDFEKDYKMWIGNINWYCRK